MRWPSCISLITVVLGSTYIFFQRFPRNLFAPSQRQRMVMKALPNRQLPAITAAARIGVMRNMEGIEAFREGTRRRAAERVMMSETEDRILALCKKNVTLLLAFFGIAIPFARRKESRASPHRAPPDASITCLRNSGAQESC